MMKSLFFLFFCLPFLGISQNISDYGTIIVPEKFQDFERNNQYNLNKDLSEQLKAKKYQVFSSDNQVSSLNPCDLLYAEVKDKGNMFRTKIELEFKTCNGKIIANIPASSNSKDYGIGFRESLQNATKTISKSNPKEVIKETTAENLENPQNNGEVKNQIYKNNSQNFEKIIISENRFLLKNINSNAVEYTFNRSFKKDIYRVEFNGIKTFGYFEGDKIFVEIPNQDESYQLQEFALQ